MKNKKKPITGLLLHFRTAQKTISCLHSLTENGIFNSIIVDNSEDSGNSIKSMRNELTKLQSRGHNTTIISPKENLGFSAGVNLGLSYAAKLKNHHILLINSDATLKKNSLYYLKKEISKHTIAAPLISQKNQEARSPKCYYSKTLALVTEKPSKNSIGFFSGCCLLIHKETLEKISFNEDFFFYGEDLEFNIRCKELGISIIECQEATVLHETSSSSKNGSLFYEYHINKWHWLITKKIAKNKKQLIIMIAARCFTLPARATIRCIRRKSLTAWKGLWMATTDTILGNKRSLTPPP